MPDTKKNSIVNLGEISKPADTLIKKISKAVGGFFAPYQVRRLAKAEAEAAIIKAQAEIEITDLHRRAAHRFIEEEAQRQRNMEDITAKALPHLKPDANPDDVDDDWIANFFNRSRIVSETQMQDLWARVLAREANTPGACSRRTVNVLSDLDKGDAALFTALCGFGWVLGNVVPLVFQEDEEIYRQNGVTFDSLSHLESIGLVQFNSFVGFRRLRLPKTVTVLYYGRPLLLEMPKQSDNELGVGKALLTRAGQELAPICGSRPVEGFWEYVQEKWKQHLPSSETDARSPGEIPAIDP